MKTARFAAIFPVIAAVACGPVESFPPHDDAGTPTNDAGETCDGVCVQDSPALWSRPTLVWMGDEAKAPLCPSFASTEFFTGHGYVDGPIPCGACTCGPTTGSCVLPAKVTAAAASCADHGSGVALISSDPPAGWGGTCNGENAIQAGKLCGGVPCVQSVTVAPLTMTQTGCLPNENTNASPPPWNRFARACIRSGPSQACMAGGELCVPAAPGPEFKQCILKYGDSAVWDCPPFYPEKSVFYPGHAPKCAPCACAAPTGGNCTGSIGLFQDGTCGVALDAAIPIDAKSTVCIDVPPGSALGSKDASKPSFQPGSCKPTGGAPEGMVICCRP